MKFWVKVGGEHLTPLNPLWIRPCKFILLPVDEYKTVGWVANSEDPDQNLFSV